MKRTTSVSAVILSALLTVSSSAFAGEAGKRYENQQDRVAQGVRSGQLTARETARIERQQAHLRGEVRDMRSDNGGTLSRREKAKVNRQQNRLSREIRHQKHDGQKQP